MRGGAALTSMTAGGTSTAASRVVVWRVFLGVASVLPVAHTANSRELGSALAEREVSQRHDRQRRLQPGRCPRLSHRLCRLANHFRCEPADGPPRTPRYGRPRREIDVLVDPERLRKLDLTVLEE
jgi:hypothetical protein